MRASTLLSFLYMLAAADGVFAATPPADAVEDARLALRTRQFPQAVALLQKQARSGSAEADYLLGLASWSGLGTNADPAAARSSLERAANRDHARAQFALAALLAGGSPSDREAAASWVKRAAAAGYTPAVAARDAGHLPLADPRTVKTLAADARFEIAKFAAASNDADLLQAIDAASLNSRRDEFGRTLLSMAMEAGSVKSAQWLLQSGAAAETVDSFGVTPLMLAARSTDEDITTKLLAAGARVPTRDRVGRDALNYAAAANQAGQVRKLLGAGASLEGVDAQGNNATDAAQRTRSDAALAALREAGGRPTMPASLGHDEGIDATRAGALYAGWPPLLIAAAHDDAADIRRRVAAGTAVEVATSRGETALLVAVDARALNAVRALLELGADPRRHDAGGASSLERAARSGNADLLAAMLDRAKPTRAEGSALLGVATQRGDTAAVRVLADHGVSVDEPDASGMRPLARAARLNDVEMVKLLIERGAVTSATDTRGRSALWYAAGSRAVPVADLLLSSRVPADVPDRSGVTPLVASIRAGDEAMVRRLIEAGAAVDAKGEGRDPPLRVAAGLGNEAVINALLARKPDVDATDAFGETALMAAARSGNESVCSKLLAAGANPRLRGRDRATAGDIASSRGFATLAKLLKG